MFIARAIIGATRLNLPRTRALTVIRISFDAIWRAALSVFAVYTSLALLNGEGFTFQISCPTRQTERAGHVVAKWYLSHERTRGRAY
jgi:hypothetical protein